MHITLEVAEDIAHEFAVNPDGLSRAALEALALQGARSGKLTVEQVRRMLGFSTRYEADGFLKRNEVYFHLTREDVERDTAIAREFSRKCLSSPTPPRSIT